MRPPLCVAHPANSSASKPKSAAAVKDKPQKRQGKKTLPLIAALAAVVVLIAAAVYKLWPSPRFGRKQAWLGCKPGLDQFLQMNFPSLMYPAGPGHTLAPQASQNTESGARGAPQRTRRLSGRTRDAGRLRLLSRMLSSLLAGRILRRIGKIRNLSTTKKLFRSRRTWTGKSSGGSTASAWRAKSCAKTAVQSSPPTAHFVKSVVPP